ncbi:MAG: FkbM family methyltransferase [Symbiobacterium sp.]|uniref:FkbM family methyltransferase n=1 Tax=Symbiobacterium sp. TaxID=1971213 RepID=UPI0034646B4E
MRQRRRPHPLRRKAARGAQQPVPSHTCLFTVPLPSAVADAVGRPHLSLLGVESDISVVGEVRRKGQYEPHVMEAIARFLAPGGTFVDVGANFGIHSVLAAALVGETGRVLAVEASPVTHCLLAHNLVSSGCPGAVAIHAAAWSQPEVLSLRHITQVVGGSHVTFTGGERPWEGVAYRVLAMPLDTLVALAGLEHVDLIKIDVEGSEYRVLQGARETLRRHRPALIIEFNQETARFYDGRTARNLHRLVRELGYQMAFLNPAFTAYDANDYAVLERIWRMRNQVLEVACTPA